MGIKVSYEQLKGFVEEFKLKTQMNVVSFLVGYKGCVDLDDWGNILQLKWDELVQ